MKGFQGKKAETYTSLAKEYVPNKLGHAEFCTLIQLSEATDQLANTVVLRYLELRAQLRSSIYDTEL